MTNTYIRKFSPDVSHDKIREFEVDILGETEKLKPKI